MFDSPLETLRHCISATVQPYGYATNLSVIGHPTHGRVVVVEVTRSWDETLLTRDAFPEKDLDDFWNGMAAHVLKNVQLERERLDARENPRPTRLVFRRKRS